MRIEAIDPSTVEARPVVVPSHITAAAQSLGISAAQMSQAFSAGASLSDVAQARGISQEDLIAAMEANPPVSLAGMVAVVAAHRGLENVGALDVLA